MDIKSIIRKRIVLFLITLIVGFVFCMNYLSKSLLPIFADYGYYQSKDVLTKILNISIEENVHNDIVDKIMVQNEIVDNYIDFNMSVINSVSCNIVNRVQQILYDLGNGDVENNVVEKMKLNVSEKLLKKGIVYEVPISMALGNYLIGNLGFKIPVKYQLVSAVGAQIISSIEDYGINNGLLKLSLRVHSSIKILVPLVTKEENIEVEIPIVVKIIQGKVPDYYLGSQMIGGVNQ